MGMTPGPTAPARFGRPWLAFVVSVLAFVVLVPRPALGCSCAAPGDLEAAIDQAPAVVVGTMLDRRDSGLPEFDQSAVYRIQVEEWVKGDLGEVIDVYSASDGAGCGLETPIGDRIGLLLSVEGKRLTGSLCSTASPDALLAAAQGPVMSQTGIPHLLVGGWNTPTLRVLDESGGLVTRLDSRARPDEFADGSTSSTSVCPGGDRLAHRTSEGLAVWDLATMEMLSRAELPNFSAVGVLDVSCRSEDGSSVWYVLEGVGGASVVDAISGGTVATYPEPTAAIGQTFALSYDYEGKTVNRHDLATDETILLYENATGELRGVYPVPNPADGSTALVETRYPDGGPVTSTLFVYDENGETVFDEEIPMEASAPVWLDQSTIAVGATDYETGMERVLYVVDTSGPVVILDDWQPWQTSGTSEEVFGIISGSIWRGDLTTGEVEQIGTIADESATALLVLEEAAPIEVDAPGEPPSGPVTPPLGPNDGIEVIDGGGTAETKETSNRLAQITFLAIVGAGVVIGLVMWRRGGGPASPPAEPEA
jgi:hypothetical protein